MTIDMDEGLSWAGLFFSDNPPDFVGELNGQKKFRSFTPNDEQWQLGGHVDRSRVVDARKIQVFWLLSHGRRGFVAKVVGLLRIYFRQFYGIVTDLDRSRFSSGYAQRRAIVLEGIKQDLRSRRILAVGNHPTVPESFQEDLRKLRLSPFEYDWYCSLLCDRLRRLAALHRIGVTHGDVKDWHFRLPGDIYDTVCFDFSE